MIKYQNLSFNCTRVNLLTSYQYQYQNQAFVEIIKNAMENKIENPTINKGIQKYIKDNKLDTDELFLTKGILTTDTKDLIELTLIEYNNAIYILSYETIEKVTDTKYSGEPASSYVEMLNYYRRYHRENGIDFQLINIHDMGFYNTLESVSGDLIKNGSNLELIIEDNIISDDRNPILKELKDKLNATVDSQLPSYLTVKGDRIFCTSFSKELVKYITDVIDDNKHFFSRKDNLSIDDEIIFFDDSKLVETLIVEYILSELTVKILPFNEIDNRIELIKSLPGMITNEFINNQTIIKRIRNEVIKSKEAKRNLYFALDILYNKTNFIQGTVHLHNREDDIKRILIDIFGLSKTTKKLYIFSKFLLMNYFSSDIDNLNDKKNVVVKELIGLSKTYNFELIIVGNSRKETNDFHNVFLDYKGIHGRYAVVVDKEIRSIKLDAELDHFDEVKYPLISYRDLSYIVLKNHKVLPKNILRIVGEFDAR